MDFNWIIQTATLLAIGAIGYFLKSTMTEVKDSIKQNNNKIEALEQKFEKKYDDLKDELNCLKSDMPFVYVLREDFIRVMNNVDKKLDRLLNIGAHKGENNDG